ncbi:DedA family protein [Alsobacter sp. SYSU M60028]|uniref:DedA family protein n=1 Tax=Alsobacter ponti TaxID=2962936 RepID=A0ABT1LFG7_9HYPH|nr:DedA family protein [Alsobacter ponti]MCP8939851.1 DedA family protein [Alsobacter ponti]
MPDFAVPVVEFIRAHEAWAAPIVFILAFGESLAFIALLLPATVILWGVGALVGASGISFWPLWLAAALGAALGDWVSYWLGYHYHAQIGRMWPLSRYPDLLPRGHRFFEKWGVAGVFLGRFFGPLRAAVPLAAGACEMNRAHFQLANWSSAAVWGATTLGSGALGVEWLMN